MEPPSNVSHPAGLAGLFRSLRNRIYSPGRVLSERRTDRRSVYIDIHRGNMHASLIQSGNVFGLHTVQTWEWDSRSPCRSVVPPFLTTGVPYFLLRFAWRGKSCRIGMVNILSFIAPVSSQLLFYLERIAFLVLSFILGELVPFIPCR